MSERKSPGQTGVRTSRGVIRSVTKRDPPGPGTKGWHDPSPEPSPPVWLSDGRSVHGLGARADRLRTLGAPRRVSWRPGREQVRPEVPRRWSLRSHSSSGRSPPTAARSFSPFTSSEMILTEAGPVIPPRTGQPPAIGSGSMACHPVARRRTSGGGGPPVDLRARHQPPGINTPR
jgi:hypothetical protein